jgi:tripartite-type tricarboxylate transporter receptor subunit TctC
MFAPVGTPVDIIQRLHRGVVVALNDAGMREQFAALGAETVGSTPAELASVVKRDIAKWAKIARQANVQAE